VHDPAAILAMAARTLDFGQPVAFIMLGILQFVVDYQRSLDVVRRLLAAAPSGSYLAIDVPASDMDPATLEAVRAWNRVGSAKIAARSYAEVAGYFEKLEVLEPGVVMMNDWRPAPGSPAGVRARVGGRRPQAMINSIGSCWSTSGRSDPA